MTRTSAWQAQAADLQAEQRLTVSKMGFHGGSAWFGC
jgi:hypothetical protein